MSGVTATDQQIEFAPGTEDEVVAAMESLRGGSGWLTFDPAIRDEHVPPTSTVFGRLLTNRGPWVPRSTWVPADMDRRRPEPVSVGIMHASGPGAVKRLAEAGLALPNRWRAVSDHPKRGLVVYVPVDIDAIDIVEWIVQSSRILTKVPLVGDWRATVHRS
jgi:hypothetical protein